MLVSGMEKTQQLLCGLFQMSVAVHATDHLVALVVQIREIVQARQHDDEPRNVGLCGAVFLLLLLLPKSHRPDSFHSKCELIHAFRMTEMDHRFRCIGRVGTIAIRRTRR